MKTTMKYPILPMNSVTYSMHIMSSEWKVQIDTMFWKLTTL